MFFNLWLWPRRFLPVMICVIPRVQIVPVAVFVLSLVRVSICGEAV